MNVLMKAFPNAITAKAGRTALLASKHSPTILFAAGVVGVVATAVAASKATLKLEDILVDAEIKLNQAKEAKALEREDYQEQDYVKDVTIVYTQTTLHIAKLYAPAIGIGILTIACLTKSHRILTSRNAALTAAYAALEKGFNEYRARVRDEFGPEIENNFRHDLEVRTVQDENGKDVRQYRALSGSPSIYARFFDQLCDKWEPNAEYNLIWLRCQQNYLNDMLQARGHVFLNEVYDRIGVERTKEGSVVGWLKNGNGDGFIDFGIFNGNSYKVRDFVNGRENAILLDFNVDGTIYDKI